MTSLKFKKRDSAIISRTRNGKKDAAAAEVPDFSSWMEILFSASNDFTNATRRIVKRSNNSNNNNSDIDL